MNLSSGSLSTPGSDLLCEISELAGSIKESFIFISSCITYLVNIRFLGELEKASYFLSTLLNRFIREGHIKLGYVLEGLHNTISQKQEFV